MKDIERNLVEGISNLFKNSRSELGIAQTDVEETSHSHEFQSRSLEEAFALKMNDSAFYESLRSAFHDIHSYKYLDDPTFAISLTKRMTAIGIPKEERQKAITALEELKKEFQSEDFEEKQSGWNVNIDTIADMTRNANNRKAERSRPFTGGGPWPEDNEIK